MSSKWIPEGQMWRPTHEYYLSKTLGAYKMEGVRISAFLVAFLGAGGALLLLIGLGQAGLARKICIGVGGVLAVGGPLVASFGMFKFAGIMDQLLEEDDAEGRKVREPLVRRLKKFAERQDRFKDLMIMNGAALKRWVIEGGGYYEIRDQWPKDFDAFGELVSEPYYRAAVKTMCPDFHVEDAPFAQIMAKRKEVYEWATRETTPEERAKANIARTMEIKTFEKLLGLKVDKVAADARGPRKEDEDDD